MGGEGAVQKLVSLFIAALKIVLWIWSGGATWPRGLLRASLSFKAHQLWVEVGLSHMYSLHKGEAKCSSK